MFLTQNHSRTFFVWLKELNVPLNLIYPSMQHILTFRATVFKLYIKKGNSDKISFDKSRKFPWQPTAFLRLNLSHKISLKTFVDLDTRREFCLSVLSKSTFFIVHKYAFSRQEVFNVLWLNQYQISSIPRPTQSSVKDLKIDTRYSVLQIYAPTSNRNCTKMQFYKTLSLTKRSHKQVNPWVEAN